MRRSYIFLIALSFSLSSCHVGRFVVYNFANITDYKKFPEKEIKTEGEPFEFKTNTGRLSKRIADIELSSDDFYKMKLTDFLDEETKTVAFMVIKSDEILYEQYFDAYDSSSIVTSFSVAKSFVSALIGIAIEEGHIQNVEEPITNYLPELLERDARFKEIKIIHLLNMRSGLKFDESSYKNPFAEIAKLYYGNNHLKQVLQTEIKKAPDQNFEYQSINTEILGIILERATKTQLANYFEEKIWQPIGMQYDASWNVDSKKHQTPKAYCCLNGRAVDFAKLGRLYLHEGNWEGKQLISKEWIERSITPNFENGCYQYQWYSKGGYRRNAFGDIVYYTDSIKANRNLDYTYARAMESIKYDGKYYVSECGPAYMAMGILGQYIYVDPEQELIIVRFGKKNDFAYSRLFAEISDLLNKIK